MVLKQHSWDNIAHTCWAVNSPARIVEKMLYFLQISQEKSGEFDKGYLYVDRWDFQEIPEAWNIYNCGSSFVR